MKKINLFGFIFSIAILTLTLPDVSLGNKNPDVVPTVSIRSPKDETVVTEDSLNVEVSFSSKEKGKANVRYIKLELDGNEVASYQNKANIKDGIHTFCLNTTNLGLGKHTLQAFAYQAELKAGLEGKSHVVIFTKSDIPIPPRIIKNPTANPDGIFVDESTLITITAEIAPDPDLMKSEITLQKLNEFNQPAEFLGYLHDDGLEGDVTADDNIYTLKVNFSEPTPSEIKLRIFAAYITVPITICSDIFTVDAIIPISEEDFVTILEIEEAALQEFESLKELHNDDKARELTVNWLKRQYGVEDAAISSDNDTIWILFTGGLEGGITTHPVGTRANPQTLSVDPPVIPETVNAIVLAPFFDVFSLNDESDYIAQKLSQLWSPTSTIKNSAATVDLMKTLSQYAVISITSHGSISSRDQVQIFTAEKATLVNRLQHIFDLMTGRIAILSGYYVINPSFIRHYGQEYPRSLVYVGACHGKANETMSNAFLDKGAYTYFGYDKEVHSSFAYSIGTRLFNYLLEDRMTTGDAFIALGNKIDPQAPHAEFLMNGGNDLVLAKPPIIENEGPTGEITENRPTIQARIYSPSTIDIDLSTIVMTLDDSEVTSTIVPETGGSDLTITYTPPNDLESGQHTVIIDAKDAIGLNATQKVWTFSVIKQQPVNIIILSKEIPHTEPWTNESVQRTLVITGQLFEYDKTINNWKLINEKFDTPLDIEVNPGTKYRIDFYNTLIKDTLFLKNVIFEINNGIPVILEGNTQVEPTGSSYNIISLFERFRLDTLEANDKTVDEFWAYEGQGARNISVITTPATSVTTGQPDNPNRGDSVFHRLHVPVPGGLQGETYTNNNIGSISSDVTYFQEGESYFIPNLHFSSESEGGGQACVNNGMPYFTAFDVIGTACAVNSYSIVGHIAGFGSYNRNINYNENNYYNFNEKIIRNAGYLDEGERRVCLGISPVSWNGRMYSPYNAPLSTDLLFEVNNVVVTCAPGKGYVGFEEGVVGEE